MRNNRTAGHNYERDIVVRINRRTIKRPEVSKEELRTIHDSSFHIFPKLVCSREVDRAADAKKRDISLVNKEREEEFPYVIQAKSYSKSVPYHKLIVELQKNFPNKIPVVFHKFTKNTGKSFREQGEYVVLTYENFMDLIYELAELKYNLKQEEHFK
jgi:hypothetical protein